MKDIKRNHTLAKWIVEKEPFLTTYHLRIEKMGIEKIRHTESDANRLLIEKAPEAFELTIKSLLSIMRNTKDSQIARIEAMPLINELIEYLSECTGDPASEIFDWAIDQAR